MSGVLVSGGALIGLVVLNVWIHRRWKAQDDLRRDVRAALRCWERGQVCTAYTMLEVIINGPWCRRTERRMCAARLNWSEIQLAREIVLGVGETVNCGRSVETGI